MHHEPQLRRWSALRDLRYQRQRSATLHPDATRRPQIQGIYTLFLFFVKNSCSSLNLVFFFFFYWT